MPVKLGEAFTDSDVARLYRYRAPYPEAVFAILRRLLVVPRIVRLRSRDTTLSAV